MRRLRRVRIVGVGGTLVGAAAAAYTIAAASSAGERTGGAVALVVILASGAGHIGAAWRESRRGPTA